MDKLAALKSLLAGMKSAVLAFSGGADSAFLAAVAREVLGDRLLAVTAESPIFPRQQLAEAEAFAKRFGLRHRVIPAREFDSPEFVANPPDRCYYCKLSLFQDLRRIAGEEGLCFILDGANLDDRGDYRPGNRAARELGIRSPLQESGFTKEEIRACSRWLGLPTWDKPAYACLASRIPYGRPIAMDVLSRIERGESFLASLNLREVRLRDHYPVARIEIAPDGLDSAWQQREAIAAALHEIGYPYVALDLDGFRSGSMNAVLAAEDADRGGRAEPGARGKNNWA